MEVKPDVSAFFGLCVFFVVFLLLYLYIFLDCVCQPVIGWVPIVLFDARSSGSVRQVGFPRRKTISGGEEWESRCRCRSGDPVGKQGGTASNWIAFNLLTCDFNQVSV